MTETSLQEKRMVMDWDYLLQHEISKISTAKGLADGTHPARDGSAVLDVAEQGFFEGRLGDAGIWWCLCQLADSISRTTNCSGVLLTLPSKVQ